MDLDRAEWKRQLQQLQFHQDCIRHQKQLVRAVCQYLALLSTEGGNLLADVQNYMDMHFCEALTLSELAAAVHVSPGYLSRFFRQKTGRTVMETIAGKKIEYARQLLDEGNLKVFEVAQRRLRGHHLFQPCFQKIHRDVRQGISDAGTAPQVRGGGKNDLTYTSGGADRLPVFSLFAKSAPRFLCSLCN